MEYLWLLIQEHLRYHFQHLNINLIKKENKNEPFICTRNSVLILLADSLSLSLRELHRESISSIKIMLGLLSRAISKRFLTSLQGDKKSGECYVLLAFTEPFGNEIRRRNGKEGGVSFGSNCFRQVRFTGTRWLK